MFATMYYHEIVENLLQFQMDFLSLGIEDEFGKSIEGILLDPSCSGSGTALSRMDHLLPLKGEIFVTLCCLLIF